MIAYLRLLRPTQITKNAFCFAGLFFSGRIGYEGAAAAAVETFVAFCAVSSAVYIFNDLIDRKRDQLHPKKRLRPLASGEVGVAIACLMAVACVGIGLAIGYHVNLFVLGCLGLYLTNNVVYSLWLKHRPLFDVLCIAFGFVLRLAAGVYAVDDLPTTWITLCTFFLSMFLGFAKRRAELASEIPETDDQQRPVLSKYTVEFLDHLVNESAVMTVMCYALFTALPAKNPTLVLTVPIVYFAVMYYKRLVMLFRHGEEPERIVLKNLRLQICIILWIATYFGITYSDLRLFR